MHQDYDNAVSAGGNSSLNGFRGNGQEKDNEKDNGKDTGKDYGNDKGNERNGPLRRRRRCAIFAGIVWSDFLPNAYLL